MYDMNGNGGVKGSQRNYNLIADIYGKENTILITFPRKEYTSPPDGAIYWKRTQNNFEHLLAAMFGCKVYYPWDEKQMFDYIKKQNIDLLFIDSSMLGRMARIDGNFKKIVFFHNVEATYALNKVKNEGLHFLPSYLASKKNEKLAMRYADTIVCLNERDKNELKKLYGRTPDYILPVSMTDIFDLNTASKSECKGNSLLFVGAYMPQNITSIEWFIKNVMRHIPDITLDIVGKGFEEKKSEYSHYKNVNVIGTVDNLNIYYYTHPIVVLPIQYGAGMKIKTVEAMMYGRTIIASDEALEGYSVDSTSDIYRCNKPEEYIVSIKKALSSHKVYSLAVRELFIKNYETTVLYNNFKKFIY